jgi:hypothetical protein
VVERSCRPESWFGAVAQPRHSRCRWGPKLTWDWRDRTARRSPPKGQRQQSQRVGSTGRRLVRGHTGCRARRERVLKCETSASLRDELRVYNWRELSKRLRSRRRASRGCSRSANDFAKSTPRWPARLVSDRPRAAAGEFAHRVADDGAVCTVDRAPAGSSGPLRAVQDGHRLALAAQSNVEPTTAPPRDPHWGGASCVSAGDDLAGGDATRGAIGVADRGLSPLSHGLL